MGETPERPFNLVGRLGPRRVNEETMCGSFIGHDLVGEDMNESPQRGP